MSLRSSWFTLVQVAYDLFLKLNPRKLASHAVIVDAQGQVLILCSRYAGAWSLPGGGVGRREHLDAALVRECREELGVVVVAEGLSGLYYCASTSLYMGVFRCRIAGGTVHLSHEHSEFCWAKPDDVPDRLRQPVADALAYRGETVVRTLA